MIDFVTPRRDPAEEELPEYVRQAITKIPSAWMIGLDAESGWSLESFFLLAQALGFQHSIVLERCLTGRAAEVEQHWEIHRVKEKGGEGAGNLKRAGGRSGPTEGRGCPAEGRD